MKPKELQLKEKQLQERSKKSIQQSKEGKIKSQGSFAKYLEILQLKGIIKSKKHKPVSFQEMKKAIRNVSEDTML